LSYFLLYMCEYKGEAEDGGGGGGGGGGEKRGRMNI
jgi:hypothetical protein